jgi:hypothetical protein
MTIPPRFRTPLIILGFVLATVAFGMAIFFVFFRSVQPVDNVNTQNENINGGTAGNLNLSGNRNVNSNAAANTNGTLPIAKVAAGGETSVESLTKSGVRFVTQDANGQGITMTRSPANFSACHRTGARRCFCLQNVSPCSAM